MYREENLFECIIQVYHSLTKAEKRIADYVLRHKADIQGISISRLAKVCDVGDATVTRFCHSVGRKSFSDLKMCAALANISRGETGGQVEVDLYQEVRAEDSIRQKCQKLCHIGTQALLQTYEQLDPAGIEQAVEMLLAAERVFCYGQGNSSIVAMDAWGRFACVSTKFQWISDNHMQVNAAAMMSERDVVLYFSFSGATRELTQIGRVIRKTPGKFILVTRYPDAPGAADANLVLICGANESPRQQGSIAAKIGQLFIIDVLFNEFCSKDPQALVNRNKTLDAAFSNME